MTAIKQNNRLISLDTPLGPNKLILTSFHGEEHLSQLFRYQLETFTDDCQITAEKLVGKQVSWQVNPNANRPHYFSGYVGEFFAGAVDMRGYRTYRLIVYPWFWFLTHSSNCRIFQQKSIDEIIASIFKDHGFSDYQLQLQQTYAKRDYCVQYNESDYAFITRQLEEEGIYYFCQHQQNKSILIIADHNNAFKSCVTNEINYDSASSSVRPHLYQWEHHYQFGSGTWSHNDYEFSTPGTSLFTSVNNKVNYANSNHCQVYQYPGYYQDKQVGVAKAKLQIASIEAQQNSIKAASNCAGLSVGGKFKLTHHNCETEQGEYIITAITHQAEDSSHLANNSQPAAYRNLFTCIPQNIPYRPLRTITKPIVRGPQTAIVVGPSNETIYTDEYGRVKVQFHWDREGQRNEQSSCWIRVGQLWSGKQWGALFIPRIGQEVIVEFLEGDPDLPLIVGCVYNGEQKPIYSLPEQKWQMGIKTKNKNGSNELRFDDKENKEQIYLHAQKDFLREVENDDTLTVKGKQNITITKQVTETVEEGDITLDVKKGNRMVKLAAGNDTLNLSQGNHTIKLNAGKSVIEAMQGIELKVGQNSIKIDNTGITLTGLMVKIEGQTMVEVKANAMLTIKGGIVMVN